MSNRSEMDVYLNQLPKCSCGNPGVIQDRLGLRCAPCELERLKPEMDAYYAEERAEEERLRIEAEREAQRQAILNPPPVERAVPMAADDAATIERNKHLLEKFRMRKRLQQLEELGLAA